MRYLILSLLFFFAFTLVACNKYPGLPAYVLAKTADVLWTDGKVSRVYYYVVIRDMDGVTQKYEVTETDYNNLVIGQRWDEQEEMKTSLEGETHD